MKTALFYVFTKPDKKEMQMHLRQHEFMACRSAFEAWCQRLRVLILCQSEKQAEKIDEYLWEFDNQRFLPHNIIGKGTTISSPIEISWKESMTKGSHSLLINLRDTISDISIVCKNIIDFVPFEEKDKVLARVRYKAYKHMGFHINTTQVEKEK